VRTVLLLFPSLCCVSSLNFCEWCVLTHHVLAIIYMSFPSDNTVVSSSRITNMQSTAREIFQAWKRVELARRGSVKGEHSSCSKITSATGSS
jgi:hypothetical protein